ncbi:MAG: hypothetical protein F6K47_08360 [Symploca sp. SIO2E6]|nr:hypothetical protein [Symploca sp. SIO2E6]
MPTTIYQQSDDISSSLPIISIDYRPRQFLSFNIAEASQGQVVRYANKAIALRCEIRGTTYTFDREHLEIMSDSERNLLYNQLGIDGRKIEASLNWN